MIPPASLPCVLMFLGLSVIPGLSCPTLAPCPALGVSGGLELVRVGVCLDAGRQGQPLFEFWGACACMSRGGAGRDARWRDAVTGSALAR